MSKKRPASAVALMARLRGVAEVEVTRLRADPRVLGDCRADPGVAAMVERVSAQAKLSTWQRVLRIIDGGS